jgi:hypothetical protein
MITQEQRDAVNNIGSFTPYKSFGVTNQQNQNPDYYRYIQMVQDGLNVADRVFDFAGEADQRRIRELQAQTELENAKNQRYASGGTVEATDIVPTLLLVGGGVLVTVLLFKAFKA